MMKIFLLSTFAAEAKLALNHVSRTLTGQWIDDFYSGNSPVEKSSRFKRETSAGEKGFRPLAAMMLYMQGEFRRNKDPRDRDDFNEMLAEIEAKYTSYGCYCWIDGVDAGVIGGGRPKDTIDHHCKELYRCYKCVNSDYNTNYTEISYSVNFSITEPENEGGKIRRNLECGHNGKEDASNICECDKHFAIEIAKEARQCDRGADDHEDFGSRCIDEQYRTINGGGLFVPSAQCDKKMADISRDHCCGIYPERKPYNKDIKECCEITKIDSNLNNVTTYEIFGAGTCEDREGVVVESIPGDPHSYIATFKKNDL